MRVAPISVETSSTASRNGADERCPVDVVDGRRGLRDPLGPVTAASWIAVKADRSMPAVLWPEGVDGQGRRGLGERLDRVRGTMLSSAAETVETAAKLRADPGHALGELPDRVGGERPSGAGLVRSGDDVAGRCASVASLMLRMSGPAALCTSRRCP